MNADFIRCRPPPLALILQQRLSGSVCLLRLHTAHMDRLTVRCQLDLPAGKDVSMCSQLCGRATHCSAADVKQLLCQWNTNFNFTAATRVNGKLNIIIINI